MIPKSMLDEINRWIVEKRYGNLQINFSGGKIVNFNRFESVKLEVKFMEVKSASANISEAGTTLA